MGVITGVFSAMLVALLYVLSAACFLAAAVRYNKVSFDLVALGLFCWVLPQMIEQLSKVF